MGVGGAGAVARVDTPPQAVSRAQTTMGRSARVRGRPGIADRNACYPEPGDQSGLARFSVKAENMMLKLMLIRSSLLAFTATE